MLIASGTLVLASSCYQSHGVDPIAPTPSADAAVDSAGSYVDCGDDAYSRGECNACARDTTWLRRCGGRAYTDGFFRAVFNLSGCDRLTLVSCAMWQVETDTYACVPPSLCGGLDVTDIEDLVDRGPPDLRHARFRPVLTDSGLEEPPTCEEMIAVAPDC